MDTTRGTRLIMLFVLTLTAAMLAAPAPAQAVGVAGTSLAGTPPDNPQAMHNDDKNVPVPALPDVLVYQGTLTSGEVPLAGRTVVLERKFATGTAWQPAGQGRTNSKGVVNVRSNVIKNALYRLRFAGDAEYGASTSAEMAMLKVHRDLNLDFEVVRGDVFIFGNINPGFGNRTVNLQKRNCSTCAWRNVNGKNSTAAGGWRFKIAGGPGVGFRVMIPSIDANFIKSTSSSADFS